VFERFTDQSRRVLVLAQEESRLLSHGFIGTEHILLGLLREDVGIATGALRALGISHEAVQLKVEQTIGLAATGSGGSAPFTPRAKKVLEFALRESMQLGDSDIGSEHLLLGLVREGEGVAAQVLVSLGAELSRVRQQVMQLLSAAKGRRLEVDPGTSVHRVPAISRARLAACSFCGLAPPQSGQLVAGNNAFICERCVRRWSNRLDPAGTSQVGGWQSEASSDLPAGLEPESAELARAKIRAAFAAIGTTSEDGQSVPTVEKGEDLGPTLAAARRRLPGITPEGAKVNFSVNQIHFFDTEHALVWFSLSIEGGPTLRRRRGNAMLVDGNWKVARSTFCGLMALAGVSCPPETE
jgi:hypothetical protein